MKKFFLFVILFSVLSNAFAGETLNGSIVTSLDECNLAHDTDINQANQFSKSEFPDKSKSDGTPHETHCHHNHCHCIFFQADVKIKTTTICFTVDILWNDFIPEAYLDSLFRPPIS